MRVIYGHGYNDGKYPTKVNGVRLPQYELWIGMIRRCYSEKGKEKFPAYADCTTSENFKSYSYFYEWCGLNIPKTERNFSLDKDLLKKGNKVYSEDNCTLLPLEINNCLLLGKWKRGNLLIGVSFREKRNCFISQISINKKNKHLGRFDTEIEAFHAYKSEKESHIKSLARKYRNLISDKAYLALMSYTVEKTD